MRVRCTYFDVLISCGMMRRAIDEGQRLLELCENDNLGVRYQLMHLYAFMEDEMHALALHKQYGANEETQMLLPLAVLYYKMNQLGKAEDYIKRLAKVNRNTKKFLRVAVRNELDEYIDEMGPYEYTPFTLEELLDAAMKARYLFDSVPYFLNGQTGSFLRKQAQKRAQERRVSRIKQRNLYSKGTTSRLPFALSTIAERYSKHHSGYHFSAFPLRGGGNALLMIAKLDDGKCMSGMAACAPL